MIKDLFEKGQQSMLDEAASQEAGKAGKLRGGNTAMLTEEGTFIGTCANLTYLRYKGIVIDPTTPSRDLMFDAGRRNEDHWLQVLKQSYPHQILCEEEIPTSWETTDGTKVTGRPDMVLLNEDSEPVCGIELKLVCSLWTARDVRFQKKPKLGHLMQAAHYSWQLGCPFELWYTCRADFAITGDWPKNLFPRAGEAGSEDCTYAYYREGEINPRTKKPIQHKINEEEYNLGKARGERVRCDILKINPFVQGYLLDIHEGVLYYKDAMVPDAAWVKSVVKISDIERYYESITTMEKNNQLMPEPKVLLPDGSKANYTASQYCSLGELCCGKCPKQKLDTWIDKVIARSDRI